LQKKSLKITLLNLDFTYYFFKDYLKVN
jgi:hypothetical protein